MSRYLKPGITVFLVVAVMGLFLMPLAGPQSASACGYGNSGGGDYVPQRRGSSGQLARRSAITKDQARELVDRHIKKLNPALEVGNMNDAGGFFEAEVLSKDKEILQVIGVDKFSGRMMLLN